MGPGMIRAVNAAGTIKDLMDKQEDFLYLADEIATEKAYDFAWAMDDEGTWHDETGDEVDSPLDLLLNYNLPNELQDLIVEACVNAYNEEYGEAT